MKILKSDSGFSLLEIIIAIGLLGGIAVGLMKILEQAQKGQKGVQNNIDFDNLRNSVTLVIRNQSLCSVGLRNAADDNAAIFSPIAIGPQTLGTLKLGAEILAQEGKPLASNLIISKINLINTSVPVVVTPGRKTYIVNLLIEANRSNAVGPKLITNKQNPFLLSVTVDSATNRIVTCGGTDPVVQKYPSTCKITLAHSDNNSPWRNTKLFLNTPGHNGLRLSGDVSNNDRLSIQGNCDPNAGPLDKYMSTCTVGIGYKDETRNANVSHAIPEDFAISSMNSPAPLGFQFSGDVNKDDSFYFQMKCPTTAVPELQEAQDYLRSNCYFCFGASYDYSPQIDTRVCSPVQNTASAKWYRFKFKYNIALGEILFPGFYCKNDDGTIVKDITWN